MSGDNIYFIHYSCEYITFYIFTQCRSLRWKPLENQKKTIKSNGIPRRMHVSCTKLVLRLTNVVYHSLDFLFNMYNMRIYGLFRMWWQMWASTYVTKTLNLWKYSSCTLWCMYIYYKFIGHYARGKSYLLDCSKKQKNYSAKNASVLWSSAMFHLFSIMQYGGCLLCSSYGNPKVRCLYISLLQLSFK